uniref:DUF1353 domain-containing protein n=1 Tax=Rhodopseudomonas sp. TaxID=1078 RepID=UPI003B3A58F5
MTRAAKRMIFIWAAVCWSLARLTIASAQADESACVAGYVGQLQLVANDDGRTFRLLSPYGYRDRACELWLVPAQATIDGASIPQMLWSLLGGPFEGKYRNASVIHDWFCDRRNMPWEQVHRIFYEAMLTSGVDEVKAKLMYFAVYYKGPRWDTQAMLNNRLVNGSIPVSYAGLDPAMLERYRTVHFAKDSEMTAGVR